MQDLSLMLLKIDLLIRIRRWSINRGLGRPYLVLATGSAAPWNKSSSELARKPEQRIRADSLVTKIVA